METLDPSRQFRAPEVFHDAPKTPAAGGEPGNQPNLNDLLRREALASQERGSVDNTKNDLLFFIGKLEQAEGGSEGQKYQWPIQIAQNQLVTEQAHMSQPVEVITRNVKNLRKLTDPKGQTWYAGISPQYGFEAETRIESGQIGGYVERVYVRLGDDKERQEEAAQLDKFLTDIDARTMFAGMFSHYKRNLENIGGLAALYLISQEVKPQHVKAEFSLPCLPEDANKELKSVGGVLFPNDVALGRMQFVAMQIYEAVSFSEKPELYKNYVKQPAFLHVVSNGLDSATKQKVTNDWFGNPDAWAPDANPYTWSELSLSERKKVRVKSKDKTVDSLAKEIAVGSRGKFTKIAGNVMAHDDDPRYPRELIEKTAEYLSGNAIDEQGNKIITATARMAAEMGWRNYRLFGNASQGGYEWNPRVDKTHPLSEKTVLDVAIPLGQDVADDFGKVMHPREFDNFYNKNSRGPFMRGEHNKVTPLATDILRSILIDGDTRKTIYDAIFVDGTWSDQIDFNRLAVRSLAPGYLRFFMATAGDYGKGSLDILTDNPSSPEPYLSRKYWQTMKSKLHVGVTKETYKNFLYIKSGGKEMPNVDSPEFNAGFDEYKLELIRVLVDGLLAEEITAKWDQNPENWGAPLSATLVNPEASGVPDKKIRGEFMSHKIINTANRAIKGLKYPDKRLEDLRVKFRMV